MIETANEKSGPTASEKSGPTAGETSGPTANSRQRRRNDFKMLTQAYKTTGRRTHATTCTESRTTSSSSQQQRPRNRQSHLRRTCQQNTAGTQQAQLSNEVAASRCETTGADGPDSAVKPSSCSSSTRPWKSLSQRSRGPQFIWQICERSIGDTETVDDHPEDPEGCRDTTGTADGHARSDTRQALGIQKCSRPWSSHRSITLRVSSTEWSTCPLLCEIMSPWSRQRRTPLRSRRPTTLTVAAADNSESTTGTNDSEGTDNRGSATDAVQCQRSWIFLCHS